MRDLRGGQSGLSMRTIIGSVDRLFPGDRVRVIRGPKEMVPSNWIGLEGVIEGRGLSGLYVVLTLKENRIYCFRSELIKL